MSFLRCIIFGRLLLLLGSVGCLDTAPGQASLGAGTTSEGEPATYSGFRPVAQELPVHSAGTNPMGGNEGPSAAPAAARLTHPQWANTVADLLGAERNQEWVRALAAEFRPDTRQRGFLFDNDARALSVDDSLWRSYANAAERIAERVVGDAALSLALTGTEDGDVNRRDWIATVGERFYRRPLRKDERYQYEVLFDSAAELFPELSPGLAGVRLVLEAMFRSPGFLYRQEFGPEVSDGVFLFDSYVVASRLSYALWDSMPDAELLRLAKAGLLTEANEVRAQAKRLLAHPRAADALGRFHADLFRVGTSKTLAGGRPSLSQALSEERRLFVNHVVTELSGSFRDLLTSSETFVNGQLSKLYDLSGDFGESFSQVTLPSSHRRGILTQLGFLVSHANGVVPDPIRRGAFVSTRLLCVNLPQPPGVLLLAEGARGMTNRELVEASTEQPGSSCAGCHRTFINPYGFPFEYYDGRGRYRDSLDGAEVNGRASVALGERRASVENALELIDVLAESQVAHECYVRHWIERALGRPASEADTPWIERLGTASRRDDISVNELLIRLVSSRAFLQGTLQ